ncbi:MAG: 16S rRNA (guanine(527)-N(7))-methyltransferase RsmG [Terracidiphilus sp.]
MRERADQVTLRLNELLVAAGHVPVPDEVGARFADYLALLLRWNAKMNLTAIRDEEGILSRHFGESIVCARALPAGVRTLLDFGSGAGFPGIPIALCCPGIAVTLAESQGKKAAFLREAVRILEISCGIHSGRAESLTARFDCVAMRAVEQMPQVLQTACELLNSRGWLALMTTEGELAQLQASLGGGFCWEEAKRLPGGERRLLALAKQRDASLV